MACTTSAGRPGISLAKGPIAILGLPPRAGRRHPAAGELPARLSSAGASSDGAAGEPGTLEPRQARPVR